MMFLLLLAMLLILLFAGIPVAFALGFASLLGFLLIGDSPSAIPQVMYDSLSIYDLASIPLFILMSRILLESRVGDHLFAVMERWVGHWPGGLGIATILSCGFFAAVSGSSTATAATVGTSAIPAMRSRGYPSRFCYGIVAGGGTLGILVPPSIPFVLYGSITGTSITELYSAGIVPAILLILGFSAYVIRRGLVGGDLPRLPKRSLRDRLSFSLRHAGVLLLPLLILGGIYAGVFVPSEAAGVGALYSLVLCAVVYRRLKLSSLKLILLGAVRVSTMIMFIIGTAILLGRLVTTLQVAPMLMHAIVGSGTGKWGFIVAISLIWIIMGDFFDPAAAMLITLPIAFPITQALGIDPVWFGVLMGINMELASVTPPVGLNLFIIMGISGERDLFNIVRGTVPFIWVMTAMLMILCLVPQTATWLPSRN